MTAVSIATTAPVQAMKISDFTVGTAAPSGSTDMELRFNTTDLQGNAVTRKEVILFCKALIRQLNQRGANTAVTNALTL